MPTGNNWKAHEGDWIFMSSPGSRMIQFHGLPIPLPLLMRASSVYPDMSSRRGNEKWVLTFSFIMVTMLKVYLMVLNDRILGSVLKHALHREKIWNISSREIRIYYFKQMLFPSEKVIDHRTVWAKNSHKNRINLYKLLEKNTFKNCPY